MDCLYRTHSPRELYALISWLPEESAFSASLKGGLKYRGWTTDRILAVLLLEQTQHNGFNFIKANSSKSSGKSLTPPKPIAWPGRQMPKVASRGSFGPIIKSLAQGGRPPINVK